MLLKYIIFAISGLFIIYSGTSLSKYGDVIGKKTPLGHGIVGGILIAAATSLPELVTSVTSTMIGAPDIAIGNVYGSNIFNLMIIALADILHNQGRFLEKVRTNHILTAILGVLLSAISVMSILTSQIMGIDIILGWVSINSIIIFGTYILGTALILRYESKNPLDVSSSSEADKQQEEDISLKKAILAFGGASLMIVLAGITLSYTGDAIAIETGLGHTFVGTLLIAATTSLPELVATIAAIRLGAYDMAVGNVLGSNVFNMLIIVISDMAYFSDSIFKVININQTITAMAGIVLSSIAVIGLFYRSKRTIFTIGWDSVFIIITYLLTVYLILIT